MLKTPEELSHEVIEANYGIETAWGEPNEHGEEGFTRAQAESDIDAHEIAGLIEQGIAADRAQRIHICDVDQGATPHHTWDNTVPRELAGVLEDREDKRSVRAAEWLAEHENDDEVWDLIGPLLDRITQLANPVDG